MIRTFSALYASKHSAFSPPVKEMSSSPLSSPSIQDIRGPDAVVGVRQDVFSSNHVRLERGSLPFKKRKFDMTLNLYTDCCNEDALPSSRLGTEVEKTPFEEPLLKKKKKNDNKRRRERSTENGSKKQHGGLTPDEPSGTSTSLEVTALSPASTHTGCYGRTTRTDSYCQRTPCYNGSQYCKLHYQQYVVHRIRSDQPTKSSSSSAPTAQDKGSSSASLSTQASSPGRSKKLKYQNKCFATTSTAAALEGGCRCQATTSRGLPCAYVAVIDTKYCFLHAEYETNPPRRRRPRQDAIKKLRATPAPPLVVEGTGSMLPHLTNSQDSPSSSNLLSSIQDLPLASLLSLPQVLLDRRGLPDVFAAPPLVTSRPSLHGLLGGSTVSSSSNSSAELPKAGASLTFLSQLAKNQWYHKSVCILAGPFQYQTGTVDRWGNGWVTIRMDNTNHALDGVLSRLQDECQGVFVRQGRFILHNRRAFELCLLPLAGSTPTNTSSTDVLHSTWRNAAPLA